MTPFLVGMLLGILLALYIQSPSRSSEVLVHILVKRLKTLRKQLKLTQRELRERLEEEGFPVSEKTPRNWEKLTQGPHPDAARALARVLERRRLELQEEAVVTDLPFEPITTEMLYGECAETLRQAKKRKSGKARAAVAQARERRQRQELQKAMEQKIEQTKAVVEGYPWLGNRPSAFEQAILDGLAPGSEAQNILAAISSIGRSMNDQ